MSYLGDCRLDAGNGWRGEFSGQLQADKPQGPGVLKDDRDGHEYSGHFQAGKFHGKGVATYDHLDRYDGEWKDGKHHGHGLRTFDCASATYEGQWQDDQKHGYGIFSYSDGTVGCGKWEQDELKLELPRAKVESMIAAARLAADKAQSARIADYDAGLFDVLKSPKYHHGGYGNRTAKASAPTVRPRPELGGLRLLR